jgi:tellurite resistance protein TerC
MLGEHWLNEWFSKSELVALSLGVIMLCIGGSIFYSIFMRKPGTPDKL